MAAKNRSMLAGMPGPDDVGAVPDPTSIQTDNATIYSAVGTARRITVHRTSARLDFRANHGMVKPSSAYNIRMSPAQITKA